MGILPMGPTRENEPSAYVLTGETPVPRRDVTPSWSEPVAPSGGEATFFRVPAVVLSAEWVGVDVVPMRSDRDACPVGMYVRYGTNTCSQSRFWQSVRRNNNMGKKKKAAESAKPVEPEIDGRITEDDDIKAVKALNAAYKEMTDEIGKVIVGQDEVIEQVLVAVFCRGHALLVGVPGLAKTLLISTISEVLQLSFKRIQFTPDLMPSDITGTDVLEEDRTTGKRIFRFVRGPLFANMILADEINRTPPKTQAALLEAMQEHMVTIGDETYPLDDPFFVLATQNPIEQEGTYPLPEAQLDRFMFNIYVDYPSPDEELAILKQVTGTYEADLTPTLTGADIGRLQQIVRRVPVADHVFQYARDLARATRPATPEAPDFINELVNWGAGPRAGIYLTLAAKARAILHGRFHATTEDIRIMALPVLRHRVITTFNAEAAGITSDEVVTRLLSEIQPAVEGALT